MNITKSDRNIVVISNMCDGTPCTHVHSFSLLRKLKSSCKLSLQMLRRTVNPPVKSGRRLTPCNRSVRVNCDYLSQLWIHYPNSSCSAQHSSVIRELYPANCRFTTYSATTLAQRHYHCHDTLPRIPPIKRKGMIIKSSGFARISHSRTKEPTAFLHLFSCIQHEAIGVALVTFRKLPRGKAKERRKRA
jgi:hypothetical protein